MWVFSQRLPGIISGIRGLRKQSVQWMSSSSDYIFRKNLSVYVLAAVLPRESNILFCILKKLRLFLRYLLGFLSTLWIGWWTRKLSKFLSLKLGVFLYYLILDLMKLYVKCIKIYASYITTMEYHTNHIWARYLRMDQVKFFKGCLPQILFSPFLNTFVYISLLIPPWSLISKIYQLLPIKFQNNSLRKPMTKVFRVHQPGNFIIASITYYCI